MPWKILDQVLPIVMCCDCCHFDNSLYIHSYVLMFIFAICYIKKLFDYWNWVLDCVFERMFTKSILSKVDFTKFDASSDLCLNIFILKTSLL